MDPRQSIQDYKEGIFGQQIWECLATAAKEEEQDNEEDDFLREIPDKIEEEDEQARSEGE